MLKKKSSQGAVAHLAASYSAAAPRTVDRRTFLRNSGLAAGGLSAVAALGAGRIEQAQAAGPALTGKVEIKKSVCTHCSVGCTVTAEVQNGVWVGQEPAWDSPINRGTHCAKGAAIREIVFDFVAFYREDPAFDAMWAQYREVRGAPEGYRAYVLHKEAAP